MSRSLTVCALALAGTMLIAVSVQAQQNEGQRPRRGGGQGMATIPGGGIGLLRLEQVEKDLKLTDEQKEKIRGLGREMRENRENAEKKLADILTPEQRDRLKQIRLQVAGPIALTADAEVAKALALTEDQVSKLKAMQREAGEKMRESFQGMRDLSPEERRAKMGEMRQKMQEMRKDMTTKALEVLTSEQREKFEKMQGAKIDVDIFSRPRGPGGRPRDQ